MDLESHLQTMLDAHGFRSDERLAVAFSGGRDSTALLLLAVRCLLPGRVAALHVNHGVRENADRDAAHCRELARELGVTYRERVLDPEAVQDLCRDHGVEGGLRELRYAALQDMCSEEDIACLVTGHHGGDLLETHFLALLRGSGLTGLAGPRKRRLLSGGLIVLRPLLSASGQELADYVGTTPFIDDETNEDIRFLRNRIRKELVPLLDDLAGSRAPLVRSVELLASDRADLEVLLDLRLEQLGIETTVETLDLRALRSLDDPSARGAIRRFLSEHGSGFPPSRELVERTLSALSEPGRCRWIDAPGLRLRVEGRQVSIDDQQDESHVEPLQLVLGIPTTSDALGVTVTAEICASPDQLETCNDRVFFDADALGWGDHSSLCLRTARPGDRFRPFGMDGSVRLFRWLAGQGVPRSARSTVPVVTLGDEIVWVVAMRRSSHAPVSRKAEVCLRLVSQAAKPPTPRS